MESGGEGTENRREQLQNERGTKQSGQPAPTGDASEACSCSRGRVSCWAEREKTNQISGNEMRNQENLAR
jgi:hypothetical protein